MMAPAPPEAVPVLYVTSLLLLFSALLFTANLRKSFGFRRARIFLKFSFYEKFFVGTAVATLVLVALDFYMAFAFPESLPLFPDVIIRVITYLGISALFLEFYRTIGLGKKSKETS